MDAGFTKGPWRAHQGWADPLLNLDKRKHPNWCEVTLDGERDDREFLSISGHFGIANARLIAAAPDLYEALKPFAAEANTYDCDDDEDGAPEISDNRYLRIEEPDGTLSKSIITVGDFRRARAALLKAGGSK